MSELEGITLTPNYFRVKGQEVEAQQHSWECESGLTVWVPIASPDV